MDLFGNSVSKFPTKYSEILSRVEKINPVKYCSSRNYTNGAVTYLSPYISRGVISTKFIFSEVLKRDFQTARIGKFIQELAWRDYWQQVWIAKGDGINQDLKHVQSPVSNTSIPKSIVEGKTGIIAIDKAIHEFYKTGYIHNHIRMYIAFLACNVGYSHWKKPAQWMYYHLLDADWASNALSWQWVAGANANKKYIANQENINKYCFTNQKNTFLDVPYESLTSLETPDALTDSPFLELLTKLPNKTNIQADKTLSTFIYNAYNLDPEWRKEVKGNRILLLEPSHFKDYPMSEKSLDFIISLAKDNINNIQVYVGEFDELITKEGLTDIHFKEHPLNKEYKGTEDPRDWMFDVKGYYPSFFAFWKKCKKQFSY